MAERAVDAGSVLGTHLDPVSACEQAIQQAETRYQLPAGILHAIGVIESGRLDSRTGVTRPWPWAVQADGKSQFFNTKAEAVAWVNDAKNKGTLMIDVGCLQVDLYFHPDAFPSVDLAFEPTNNVDYAARYLLRLHAMTNDWDKVVGFYHSQTPELAEPYQKRVQQIMGAPMPKKPVEEPSLLTQVARAWRFADPTVTLKTSSPKRNSWDSLLPQTAIEVERPVVTATSVPRVRGRNKTTTIAAIGLNY